MSFEVTFSFLCNHFKGSCWYFITYISIMPYAVYLKKKYCLIIKLNVIPISFFYSLLYFIIGYMQYMCVFFYLKKKGSFKASVNINITQTKYHPLKNKKSDFSQLNLNFKESLTLNLLATSIRLDFLYTEAIHRTLFTFVTLFIYSYPYQRKSVLICLFIWH